MMKGKHLREFLGQTFSWYLVTALLGHAGVQLSNTAPNTNVIATANLGAISTSLFPLAGTTPAPIAGNANHARGQLFSLDAAVASTYEITAITFQKNTAQTFSNDSLTLRIFQGDSNEWTVGSGHSVTDTSFYKGSFVMPLHEEVFTLNGAIQDDAFITLELVTPLLVDLTTGEDFGFFMTYDPSSGTSPDRLVHLEGNNGGRVSITTASHGVSARSMNHFVEGSAQAPPVSVIPLELGSPFQHGMILQRDKAIKVWGVTEASAAVTVSIDGTSASGTANAVGEWEIELPAHLAGGPHSLEVSVISATGTASEILNNVLFGDVWFCFGQSNMNWRFQDLSGASTWDDFYVSEIMSNDQVRCLLVDEDASLVEEETAGMTWLSNSTANSWTAVGSVFAYQLHTATGVPVGIVSCAWGSSSIEGWMPRELENDFPHFQEMLSQYQSVDEFRASTPVSTHALSLGYSSNLAAITDLTTNGWSTTNEDLFIRTRPNILYNRRVHPLRNFGLSGFIWYQGEANSTDVLDIAQYQFSLPRFVEEYRERFGQGDLPFLGVQLPSFNNSLWPWFREAQDSLRTLPNGYVAVALDTGEANNIHPSDKEEIGARLALLAREHALGESIEADSPRYVSQAITGNQVTLTFDHAVGLTTTDGAAPAGFEVAGADEVFHAVTAATITGNTITVSSSAEPAPVAVRYAWTATTHSLVNVINGAPQPLGASGAPLGDGLPLAPFRTDDFPLDGLSAQVPFGVSDSYSLLRDGVLAVPAGGVLENDYDLNHDPLGAVFVTNTSHGALSFLADGSFTYTPEEGFAGVDGFTYEAAEANGSLSSPATVVTLTVEGTPSAYYLWRQSIAWSPGADESSNGDPDGDGVTNFVEFALSMNPLVQDRCNLPTFTPTASGADYSFDNSQPGVTYEVLLSADLVTWSNPAFATLDHTDTTPVSIPSSEDDGVRIFVRLRMSESANN